MIFANANEMASLAKKDSNERWSIHYHVPFEMI
jgi:hypothetical protein